MRKGALGLACIVVVALGAGCGDSGGAQTMSASTTSTTTTTTEAAQVMVPVDIVEDPGSCATAAASQDLARVISAFIAARTSGAGAEDCLTTEALDHYCDASGATCTDAHLDYTPGPNCLYECYGGRTTSIDADWRRVAEGRYQAYLQVRYSGEYGGANEGLDITVEDGQLLISAVSTSA